MSNRYVTQDNYKEFKRKYTRAVSDKSVTFEFEGQLVMTEYARYVVRYIENGGDA